MIYLLSYILVLKLSYEDTFDIMLCNNVTCCNGIPVCRITYDINGRQIDDSVPIAMNGWGKIKTVAPDSPLKGFFSIDVYGQKRQLVADLKYVN